MSVLPEGEQLRRAVRWISSERQERASETLTKLIQEACIKFDLSPSDTEFLMNFFSEKKSEKQT